MRKIATATLGLLVCAGAAFGQQDRVTAGEKGSFLVINKIEVRWENVPPFNLVQDTFVHLTNDFPAPVNVKMYFVNGDEPIFSAHWEGGEELDRDMIGRMSESRYEDIDLEEAEGGDTGARDHPGWN